jgi:hypothetical protein
MLVRRGVSNTVFAGTTIVLLIIAGIGFSLYLTAAPATHTTTENMTETTTTGMTETTAGNAIQFTSSTGQMIHTAWLLIQSAGMGDYAVSVHAEGLENTQAMGSVYIVEAEQSSGSMSVAPIGPNATASEFETGSTGVGNFFIVLMQNPFTSFENIQIVYLPAMEMANATVVATASLH